MDYLSIHEYPLPTRHEGGALGNGYLGLYAWGSGRVLSLTIGCSALWDHRGGLSWSPKQNFHDILKCLRANDEAGLKAIYPHSQEYYKWREKIPSIIPVGRVDLTLSEGCVLLRNELDRGTGLLRVIYATPVGESAVEIRLDMQEKGLVAFRCDANIPCKLLSGYDCCVQDTKNTFDPMGACEFPHPRLTARGSFQSFVQEMPADPAYGMALRQDSELHTLRYRQNTPAEELQAFFDGMESVEWSAFDQKNRSWWETFWKRVPKLWTGDDLLDELYVDGLYKFESMTEEHGVPAGLQGPWIEDCGFPPWSSDYHLNINLEMCYWPSYRSGLFGNLRKVLDLVWSWRDTLRHNAKCYIGIDDGYMLAHSVDDRCTSMGNFWTGEVDHACTAWMAQMMFDYYDYTGDEEYLKTVAFPFMKGAMNVYLAQMETDTDGTLCLPLTVSPEYGAADMEAWGKNASFQLAACHRLNRNLLKSAGILGEVPDKRWLDVEERLPLATLGKDGQRDVIALWEDQMLEESHRHHSHLAGIVPFDTLPQDDPKWSKIIQDSLMQWVEKGMGLWTGWCMSWAAMLHNHLDEPEAAQEILYLWKHFFTNKGGSSTHDAQHPGIFLFCQRRNIMQMDGAMGCLTAVQDCLLHSRNGVLHLFAGIVRDPHRNAGFQEMPAPGGFLVSAERKGHTATATIRANRKNTLRLVCHCDGKLLTALPQNASLLPNGEIQIPMEKDEVITLVFSP